MITKPTRDSQGPSSPPSQQRSLCPKGLSNPESFWEPKTSSIPVPGTEELNSPRNAVSLQLNFSSKRPRHRNVPGTAKARSQKSKRQKSRLSPPSLCANTALGAEIPLPCHRGCPLEGTELFQLPLCPRDGSPALPGWGVGNPVPSMEVPPGTASPPGVGGESLCGGTVPPCRGCRCPLPGRAQSGQCVRGERRPRVPGDFLLPRALLLLAPLHLFQHKRGTVR